MKMNLLHIRALILKVFWLTFEGSFRKIFVHLDKLLRRRFAIMYPRSASMCYIFRTIRIEKHETYRPLSGVSLLTMMCAIQSLVLLGKIIFEL